MQRRSVLPDTADRNSSTILEIQNVTKVKTAASLGRILAPAILLAIATAAMPAGADDLNAPLSQKVNYSDLDVTHEAGVKALYTRIESAAHKVCEPAFSLPRLQQRAAWNKCLSNAESNAVQSIGLPALTSLYEAKTGTVVPTQLALLQVR